jgi:coiled-coil domain-containing protein 130
MQGFNMGRYVPPDLEGTMSGNRLHGKHPLGSRANKSSQGILTVRFEMPFPIWCTTCPKPTIIGQGVRFNAEKKKVGAYFSTPIWSFRLKHTACGGWIEIRTDPKETRYVVVEGARARDTGEGKLRDEELEGGVKILTEAEREERRANAFAALEGKNDDKVRLEKAKERIEEIQELQDRQWEDPYSLNRRLREKFRVGRHAREQEAKVAGALQDKMSLGIELVPESKEDRVRAGMVEFGNHDQEQSVSKAVIAKPLFPSAHNSDAPTSRSQPAQHTSKKLKAAQAQEKHRAALAEEIRGNTRAKTDPFLLSISSQPDDKPPPWKALGVKRKRDRDVEESVNETGVGKEKDLKTKAMDRENEREGPAPAMATVLVDYDSD